MNEEYRKRDNSIGSLQQDVADSFKRVIMRLGRTTKVERPIVRLDKYLHHRYLVIVIYGIEARIDLTESTPRCMMSGKSVREKYYGEDRRSNRLIENLEDDIKDFALAFNRQSEKTRNDLFSI